MKKRRFAAALLGAMFAVGAVFCVAGCDFSNLFGGGETAKSDDEFRSVYALYTENCAARGEEPLTYDEWLTSIRGEKGDKGETGSGWLYGNGAPASSLGRNGDLYLDCDTWNVYTKDNGTWTKRGCIKGEKGDPGTGGTGGTGGSEDVGVAEMSVIFLELGNGAAGDCTLIKTGDTEVLIDAGSSRGSAATLVPKIKTYCTDGVLEYVIVTHAHEDHIAAFVGNNGSDGIFANFKCGTIIDFPKYNTSSNISKDYFTYRDREVSSDGAKHYTALQCWNEEGGAQRVYNLNDGISFEILYQKYYETSSSSENNFSVCTLFTQGDYHYLFTGDLELAGEQSLVSSNELPHCKLFKAGHHGSVTSTNECLLEAITPEYVCVSCCAGTREYTTEKDNQFPTQDMINRVAPYTKNIFVTSVTTDGSTDHFTSMNGDVTFTSDGVSFTVHGSNNDTVLKDTSWFKSNRTWPANGVV